MSPSRDGYGQCQQRLLHHHLRHDPGGRAVSLHPYSCIKDGRLPINVLLEMLFSRFIYLLVCINTHASKLCIVSSIVRASALWRKTFVSALVHPSLEATCGCHHGSGLPSRNKPPLGPSLGRVAAHTIPAAPSATGRPPVPPMSVATQPGQTEFTRI